MKRSNNLWKELMIKLKNQIDPLMLLESMWLHFLKTLISMRKIQKIPVILIPNWMRLLSNSTTESMAFTKMTTRTIILIPMKILMKSLQLNKSPEIKRWWASKSRQRQRITTQEKLRLTKLQQDPMLVNQLLAQLMLSMLKFLKSILHDGLMMMMILTPKQTSTGILMMTMISLCYSTMMKLMKLQWKNKNQVILMHLLRILVRMTIHFWRMLKATSLMLIQLKLLKSQRISLITPQLMAIYGNGLTARVITGYKTT